MAMRSPTPAAGLTPDSAAAVSPAFDRQRLADEMGNLSPLRSITLDAVHEFPRYLEYMRRSAREERLESLSTFARQLACLCSSLHAPDAAHSAETLHYAAESADQERIAASLGTLETQLERLVHDLADACDIVL